MIAPASPVGKRVLSLLAKVNFVVSQRGKQSPHHLESPIAERYDTVDSLLFLLQLNRNQLNWIYLLRIRRLKMKTTMQTAMPIILNGEFWPFFLNSPLTTKFIGGNVAFSLYDKRTKCQLIYWHAFGQTKAPPIKELIALFDDNNNLCRYEDPLDVPVKIQTLLDSQFSYYEIQRGDQKIMIIWRDDEVPQESAPALQFLRLPCLDQASHESLLQLFSEEQLLFSEFEPEKYTRLLLRLEAGETIKQTERYCIIDAKLSFILPLPFRRKQLAG